MISRATSIWLSVKSSSLTSEDVVISSVLPRRDYVELFHTVKEVCAPAFSFSTNLNDCLLIIACCFFCFFNATILKWYPCNGREHSGNTLQFSRLGGVCRVWLMGNNVCIFLPSPALGQVDNSCNGHVKFY